MKFKGLNKFPSADCISLNTTRTLLILPETPSERVITQDTPEPHPALMIIGVITYVFATLPGLRITAGTIRHGDSVLPLVSGNPASLGNRPCNMTKGRVESLGSSGRSTHCKGKLKNIIRILPDFQQITYPNFKYRANASQLYICKNS